MGIRVKNDGLSFSPSHVHSTWTVDSAFVTVIFNIDC